MMLKRKKTMDFQQRSHIINGDNELSNLNCGRTVSNIDFSTINLATYTGTDNTTYFNAASLLSTHND